jgi:hypothetical protein
VDSDGWEDDRRRLAERLRVLSETYELGREDTARWIASEPPSARAFADVSALENDCALAVLARGSADAPAYAPLVARAVAQVTVLDARAPDVAGRLAVLNVLCSLQVMGLPVPDATVGTARGWLAGMPTEGREPESWHWQRGWAALALGDLRTARTIAAVTESGPTGVDPGRYPEFDIQAWLGLFVAGVVGEVDWSVLSARWSELLLVAPVLEETKVLALRDLQWVARVVHARIAGHPVGTVADWLHDELRRVAGL